MDMSKLEFAWYDPDWDVLDLEDRFELAELPEFIDFEWQEVLDGKEVTDEYRSPD